MKKNISPNKKSHFLTVVTIIALVNVGLIAYFDPRSLVYQKEIGNTEFGTPYPPTNLTATANSTSQITLTWQPGPIGEFYEPTAFIIYRTIGNNTDFSNAAPYDSAPSYAVSYVDTNLTPGTVYNYKVAARNGTLESSNSNLASAITFSPVPGQPTGVVATATAHNQVQLSWDQVQNATLYHIYRRQNEPAFAEIGTTPSPGFNDNSVSPSLTYAYYIVAENSGGSGPSSAVVSAVTPAAPAQPSNPLPAADTIAPIVSNVVVQKDIISAQISWTTNEVSGGFIVYGKTQNYGMSQSYGFNTAHQISLVNLEQNTEYYFKIIATDASQNSSEYSGVFTTLPASVPLAPPSNFYSSTSTGRIMLSWKNPNDARFRGVKILRKVGATSVNAFDGEMVGDTTAEMFEDLSALYGVDYVYTAYSYGSGVEISSGVVARARLSFLGALPDNTPSSTSPTSSIVTTRCDAQKPDCKSSACASLAVCKNSSLNTSSTVSAFPLSSVSFLYKY
jgi:fibronectin type 3 domain-containing protein